MKFYILSLVRAVVDENDYAKTKEIVEQFAKGVGRELHEQLEARSKGPNGRNWVGLCMKLEVIYVLISLVSKMVG